MEIDFKQYMEEFLLEALETCKSIEREDPLDEMPYLVPVFKNSKYDRLAKKTAHNYKDFFIKHADKVCDTSLDSFKAVNILLSENNALKKYFKGKVFNEDAQPANELEPYTKDILLDFVRVYVADLQSFEFDRSLFNNVFSRFIRYVDGDINTIYYFAPLHNFTSEVDSKWVDDNIQIRRISRDEFGEIAGLEQLSLDDEVPVIYWFVTHIITLTLANPSNFYEDNRKAMGLMKQFLDSMRIFDLGDVMIGAVYRKYSTVWKTKIALVDRGDVSPSKNKMTLTKEKFDSSVKFYKAFSKLNLTSDLKYLGIAISKFSSALERSHADDKIVDFIICLEALILDSPGEASLRFAIRLAILLGNDDEEREFTWLFLRQCYNLRSGIVHGEGFRKFGVSGKQYSLAETSQKLESMTRDAIKKILNLAVHYSKQRELLSAIDLSVFSRARLSQLQKRAKYSS